MNQQIDETDFSQRIISELSAFFGLVATLLAAIGLYGVMSFTVTRRTREIGIPDGARRRPPEHQAPDTWGGGTAGRNWYRDGPARGVSAHLGHPVSPLWGRASRPGRDRPGGGATGRSCTRGRPDS